MGNHTDGIVLIDKGEGVSSARAVRQVRTCLKVKKAGHAGTLDPFATGLLIILLGQGTKLSSYIMASEKTYLATMRLGIETDTLDSTGRVLQTRPVPDFRSEDIEEAVRAFTGDIKQTPPAFSALKYKGRRAYEWAREGVQFELRERHVHVRSIVITAVRLPEIIMEVTCSKGTYIRSLASDFGRRIGPGGHLTALRRVSSGPFKVDEAVHSEEIRHCQNRSAILEKIIPLGDALPQLEGAQVNHQMAGKIRNGYRPGWVELDQGGEMPNSYSYPIKLLNGKELVAIIDGARIEGRNSGRVKIMRVFH